MHLVVGESCLCILWWERVVYASCGGSELFMHLVVGERVVYSYSIV
jgi:hypothetical protein